MSRGFRVWDNQAKSYDFDREFVLSSDGNLMELWSNHNGTWDYHFADEDRFIVEQDTGLEDKSGERIREGDIVKKYDDGDIAPIIGVVEFYKYGARFAVSGGRFILSQRWVVVGNIHENPELLEN